MALNRLPKKLHPDFRQPRRKPVGPVKLNHSHPLAPDDACVLLNNSVMELVYNEPLKIESGEAHAVIDANNIAQKFDGAQLSSYALNRPIDYHVAGDLWSITWKGRNEIGNTSDTVFCGLAGTSDNYIQMRSTNAFRVSGNGSFHTLSGIGSNVWDKSDWNTVIFTSSGYSLYKNGQLLGSYTDSNAAASVRIANVGNGYNSASFAFDGYLEALYIHSRPLSETEVKLLHADPYQILEPATPAVYYTSAAGGAFTLTADSGSYTYTGTANSLLLDALLTGNAGTYSYSGTVADLTSGFGLQADSGTYSYTGSDVALLFDALLAADSGTYSYSGTSNDLRRDGTLDASSGVYAYSGTDATLTFESPGDFTLPADTGTYSVSGTNADLLLAASLTGDSGAYGYTGNTVDLFFGVTLVADSGAYTYTGTDATFSTTLTLNAESGLYVYNGNNATLKASGQVWTIQADSVTTWTNQTDSSTTWTIQ